MKYSILKDVSLVLLVCLCAFMFYLGNKLTVLPHQTSGNGNLGLFVALLLLVISPFIILLVVDKFKRLNLKQIYIWLTMLLSFLYICIGYYYQLNQYIKFKEQVKKEMLSYEHMADINFINSVLGGFSQYLNSQYFNVNTFLMFNSLLLLLSSIIVLYHKFKFSENHILKQGF